MVLKFRDIVLTLGFLALAAAQDVVTESVNIASCLPTNSPLEPPPSSTCSADTCVGGIGGGATPTPGTPGGTGNGPDGGLGSSLSPQTPGITGVSGGLTASGSGGGSPNISGLPGIGNEGSSGDSGLPTNGGAGPSPSVPGGGGGISTPGASPGGGTGPSGNGGASSGGGLSGSPTGTGAGLPAVTPNPNPEERLLIAFRPPAGAGSRASGGGYVGRAGSQDDCQTSTGYQLSADGVLSVYNRDDLVYSTDPSIGSAPFLPSTSVGTITTFWSIGSGNLSWINSAFRGNEAVFCQTVSTAGITAYYTDSPPANCERVFLTAEPAADCPGYIGDPPSLTETGGSQATAPGISSPVTPVVTAPSSHSGGPTPGQSVGGVSGNNTGAGNGPTASNAGNSASGSGAGAGSTGAGATGSVSGGGPTGSGSGAGAGASSSGGGSGASASGTGASGAGSGPSASGSGNSPSISGTGNSASDAGSSPSASGSGSTPSDSDAATSSGPNNSPSDSGGAQLPSDSGSSQGGSSSPTGASSGASSVSSSSGSISGTSNTASSTSSSASSTPSAITDYNCDNGTTWLRFYNGTGARLPVTNPGNFDSAFPPITRDLSSSLSLCQAKTSCESTASAAGYLTYETVFDYSAGAWKCAAYRYEVNETSAVTDLSSNYGPGIAYHTLPSISVIRNFREFYRGFGVKLQRQNTVYWDWPQLFPGPITEEYALEAYDNVTVAYQCRTRANLFNYHTMSIRADYQTHKWVCEYWHGFTNDTQYLIPSGFANSPTRVFSFPVTDYTQCNERWTFLNNGTGQRLIDANPANDQPTLYPPISETITYATAAFGAVAYICTALDLCRQKAQQKCPPYHTIYLNVLWNGDYNCTQYHGDLPQAGPPGNLGQYYVADTNVSTFYTYRNATYPDNFPTCP